ncbi:hypothetical protein EDB84DRAFT_1565492 [Lactarius hengduanensis]|nr:hypothetical protein EDB84DRAFT_1565492 [Lactarius hengduanensis]
MHAASAIVGLPAHRLHSPPLALPRVLRICSPSPALPRASPVPSRRRLCPCAACLLSSPALPPRVAVPSRRRLCPVRCVSTLIAGFAPCVAVPSRHRLCPVCCASAPIAGLAPRVAVPSRRRLCPVRCVSTLIAGFALCVAVPSRRRLCPVRCASTPIAGIAPRVAVPSRLRRINAHDAPPQTCRAGGSGRTDPALKRAICARARRPVMLAPPPGTMNEDESSEAFIGEWVEKRGICDQLVLTTKYSTSCKRTLESHIIMAHMVTYSGNNTKSLHLSVDASLKTLRTTYSTRTGGTTPPPSAFRSGLPEQHACTAMAPTTAVTRNLLDTATAYRFRNQSPL